MAAASSPTFSSSDIFGYPLHEGLQMLWGIFGVHVRIITSITVGCLCRCALTRHACGTEIRWHIIWLLVRQDLVHSKHFLDVVEWLNWEYISQPGPFVKSPCDVRQAHHWYMTSHLVRCHQGWAYYQPVLSITPAITCGCTTAQDVAKCLMPWVALQLTNTSECGGNSTRRANFNLAWVVLTLSGRHSTLSRPIVKSFCLSDKSQSWAAKKSARLSFLGLITTSLLYTHAAIPTYTSA